MSSSSSEPTFFSRAAFYIFIALLALGVATAVGVHANTVFARVVAALGGVGQ